MHYTTTTTTTTTTTAAAAATATTTTLHYITLHYTTLHYITLHYYTTTLLHYYTTTLLHYYTTTLLHYYTTTLLHYYTTTLLHYYTTTLLHYYTTTLRHYDTTTLLHYYTTTLLHYYTTTLLHYYTTLHCTALHYITLHYTNYTALHHSYNYTTFHCTNYTALPQLQLHYLTLDYTTLYHTTLHSTHDIALHYTRSILNRDYNRNCACTCTNCTTLQLQLRYTTPQLQLQPQLWLQLHYTTLHPAVVVRWPLQPLRSKKHHFNHLSVHQWIRSAIRDSQQPTSSIGFLFLKLPPPPCAVLLVDIVSGPGHGSPIIHIWVILGGWTSISTIPLWKLSWGLAPKGLVSWCLWKVFLLQKMLYLHIQMHFTILTVFHCFPPSEPPAGTVTAAVRTLPERIAVGECVDSTAGDVSLYPAKVSSLDRKKNWPFQVVYRRYLPHARSM